MGVLGPFFTSAFGMPSFFLIRRWGFSGIGILQGTKSSLDHLVSKPFLHRRMGSRILQHLLRHGNNYLLTRDERYHDSIASINCSAQPV